MSNPPTFPDPADKNIARIRTALPQVWGAVLVYVATRIGWTPDDVAAELATIVVIPVAGAVVYDVGRWLETTRFRSVARIILGSLKAPTYD